MSCFMSILDVTCMIKIIPGPLSFYRRLYSSSHNVHCGGSSVFVKFALLCFLFCFVFLYDRPVLVPSRSLHLNSLSFLHLSPLPPSSFTFLHVLLHAAVETTICPGTI